MLYIYDGDGYKIDFGSSDMFDLYESVAKRFSLPILSELLKNGFTTNIQDLYTELASIGLNAVSELTDHLTEFAEVVANGKEIIIITDGFRI